VILRFRTGTTGERLVAVQERCAAEGLAVVVRPDSQRPVLGLAGDIPSVLAAELAGLSDVEEVVQLKIPAFLVSRAFQDTQTVVDVGGVRIGGEQVVVIAGPCSVEGLEVMQEAARAAHAAGAHILRGGAFKPRTSPYDFQGFGVEGLGLLKEAGEAVKMPVVSEIMDASHLPAFLDHDIDCLQIGSRNMQNYTLLAAVAEVGKPVLLKRGQAATAEEWLLAAEHLALGGCEEIVLCERGIRTFERATRNTLDLTILPLMREWTHLPIMVDPSHAAGIARIIPPLARAAVALGVDGLAVEMHPDPKQALSDADQSLRPEELAELVVDTRRIAAVTPRVFPPTRPGGQ
jgi:3-deoxy-7-phosphoheptulonate synthase